MAISLPDSRYLADNVIHALCLRALHARELGFTEQQIADILGVTRETVCRWWTAYCQRWLQNGSPALLMKQDDQLRIHASRGRHSDSQQDLA